ncbi:MAG: hypothetical protein JSS66_13775 [Armatimonadetes bacterium]|nr:hypothetical protein [Armatimonadota bacterium]
MTKAPWWVYASLAAATLTALVALASRYRAEASNKAVGTLMEAQAIHELTAVSGIPFATALPELREHGLTGVALTEETVADLIASGKATAAPMPTGGVRFTGNKTVIARIAKAISRRGGLTALPVPSPDGTLDFNGDLKALVASSAGLDPVDAKAVTDAGMELVARHFNAVGAGPAYIRDLLDESQRLGAIAYLAAGEQVLGQRESVDDTAATLADLKMKYLTPEFAKISGDAKLSSQIPELTIRLHSMQQAEIDKSTPGSVLERYSKAFRERNIRWLLLRPVSIAGPDALASTQRFLDSVRNAVGAEGGAIKPPRPFVDPGTSRLVFLGIGVFAAPWVFWTVRLFGSGRAVSWLAALAALAVAGASAVESLRPLAALGIGVSAPVLAYGLFLRGQLGKSPWLQFVLLGLLCLLGGFMVAGLLNGLPYMLQIKQALGIKLILLGPVVAVGWLLLVWATNPRELYNATVKVGPAMVSLLILAAVAFLVIRSGNDAPSAVSDTELRFRALLDKYLYTRPRTKEILVGHPALILGLMLWRESARRAALKVWSAIALAIGAIGLADIVDTMCHIHTPLDIGVARVLIGMLVGGMIGAVLWLPLRFGLKSGGEA